jgi:hypothetical protein
MDSNQQEPDEGANHLEEFLSMRMLHSQMNISICGTASRISI